MFISLKELKGLFTGLFATSNPRKIDGGATLTCTEVVVGDDEVELVPASSVRRRVIIQNVTDAEIVAIGPAGVTTATGHILRADTGGNSGTGGEVVLFTQDAVHAIATGAAREVRVLVEAD